MNPPGLEKYLKRIPDVIDPIKAYRAWSYSKGGLFAKEIFTSTTYHEIIWEPGVNYSAKCIRSVNNSGSCYNYDESSPHETGRCGFYSMKSSNWAIIALAIPSNYFPIAIGEVLIWGKIIEHEQGYRSEFARLNAIKWIIKERNGEIIARALLANAQVKIL